MCTQITSPPTHLPHLQILTYTNHILTIADVCMHILSPIPTPCTNKYTYKQYTNKSLRTSRYAPPQPHLQILTYTYKQQLISVHVYPLYHPNIPLPHLQILTYTYKQQLICVHVYPLYHPNIPPPPHLQILTYTYRAYTHICDESNSLGAGDGEPVYNLSPNPTTTPPRPPPPHHTSPHLQILTYTYREHTHTHM